MAISSTHLGKYELLRELGRGAFGTVYLARDTLLDVERALKVLHPYLVHDETLQARFRREAQVAARLEHPHIVPVYEFGEVEGQFYLAMRYMAGGSLKARLSQEGHLPWVEALHITQELAEGLTYAHAYGVVHRDLKPSNILFDQAGRAAIGDFGFAKVVGEGGTHLSLTGTGGLIGTPAYMAPEVWQGKEVGPAADQYALACLVVEMLTGEVLFGGETPWEVLEKHKQGPAFPARWSEDVPEGLETVLHKALAQEPGERYPDVAAFAEALVAIHERARARAEAQAAAARARAMRLEQARAAAREGRWGEAWAAVGAIWRDEEATGRQLGQEILALRLDAEKAGLRERMETEGVRGIADMLNEVRAWGETLGVEVSWGGWGEHILTLLSQTLEEEDWDTAQGWLQVLGLVAPARMREGEQRYWERRLMVAAAARNWQEVVRSGRHLLALEEDMVQRGRAMEPVLAADSEADASRNRPKSKATLLGPTASSKSEAVQERTRSQDGVVVLEVQDEWWQRLLGGRQIYSVAFSPDGALLASASQRGTHLWRVADGYLIRALKYRQQGARSVRFSSDGLYLVVGTTKGTVLVWQVLDGHLVRILEGHKGKVNSVDVSPDGALLATGAEDATINLWRGADGRRIRSLEGHTDWVRSVAFSPDGALLASASDDRTVRLWRVTDGRLVHTLKHGAWVYSVAFSPDGALLVTGTRDGMVQVWQTANGAWVRTLGRHIGWVTGVAFSPDGRMVAAGSRDGKVRLWRTSDGALVRSLKHDTGVRSIAFSPDGMWLAAGLWDGTLRLWRVVESRGDTP